MDQRAQASNRMLEMALTAYGQADKARRARLYTVDFNLFNDYDQRRRGPRPQGDAALIRMRGGDMWRVKKTTAAYFEGQNQATSAYENRAFGSNTTRLQLGVRFEF